MKPMTKTTIAIVADDSIVEVIILFSVTINFLSKVKHCTYL